MTNIRFTADWRTGWIFAVVLVQGTFIGAQYRANLMSPLPNGSRSETGSHATPSTVWDRYRIFRVAYHSVLAGEPRSYGISDFAASRPVLGATSESTERALATFSRTIHISPDEDGAWNNIAWLLAIQGNLTQAIAVEQKALALAPYDYTYELALGVYYERAGDRDDAIRAYSNALLDYPRVAQSSFWRALSARQSALADAAIQAALSSLTAHQSAATPFDLEVRARLLLATGRIAESSQIAISATARAPNLAGAWELQGEAAETTGDLRPGNAELSKSNISRSHGSPSACASSKVAFG